MYKLSNATAPAAILLGLSITVFSVFATFSEERAAALTTHDADSVLSASRRIPMSHRDGRGAETGDFDLSTHGEVLYFRDDALQNSLNQPEQI